jgi:hypothetical protein
MRAKILIGFVIVLLAVTCKKDEYSSTPQITLKEVNSTTISQGDVVTFTINFTDAEGDLQDTMWIQRVSKICPTVVSTVYKYKVPDFPAEKYLKGTLEVNFAYNVVSQDYPTITGCGTKNDTSYFRFWVRDKAKNVSDTIKSQNIAFLK